MVSNASAENPACGPMEARRTRYSMNAPSESQYLPRATILGIAFLAVVVYAATEHWATYLLALPHGTWSIRHEQRLDALVYWGQSILAAVLLIALYRAMPKQYRPDVGCRWPKWWWYPTAIAAAIVLFYASRYLADLLVAAGFPYTSPVYVFRDAKPALAIALILDFGLVSPFIQEVVFRGWLFSGLTRTLPFVWSALLSTAAFSLSHVLSGAPALAFTFLFGLSMAILFQYSRSIVPPTIAHVVNNVVATTLFFRIH